MTDDLHRALGGGGRIYRRKRVHKGEEFKTQDPPSIQDVHKGLWCPRCKVRHPYNGSDSTRLVTYYEQRGKAWVMMFTCPNYGDHVGEIWLVDSAREQDDNPDTDQGRATEEGHEAQVGREEVEEGERYLDASREGTSDEVRQAE